MPSTLGRPKSKAAEKRDAKFIAGAAAKIEALGAVPLERGGHKLATPLGPLYIHVYDDWIATRFTCADAAYRFSGSRNGKWNWHAHEGGTHKAVPETALAWCLAALERLLAHQPTADDRRQVMRELEAETERNVSRAVSWAEWYRQDHRRLEAGDGI